jgi:hypothetical protein
MRCVTAVRIGRHRDGRYPAERSAEMKRPAEASLGIHAAYRAATAGFARY